MLRERREHRVFQQLLQIVPGLEDRIMEGSDKEVAHIADLVCITSYPSLLSVIITSHVDTEGRLQCEIG